jgi:asparagine synthetase B (glutamine-hydrolysing)
MIDVSPKHYKEFRTLFVDYIRKSLPSEPVGLAMSGGIDSASVFFALLEIGHEFECYTFYQDGYESEDLVESKKYCEQFSIKLNLINMNSDVDTIYNDINKIIPFCGVKLKKTKVETLRPLMYLFENSKHKTILNGYSADEYMPYSRKCNILYGSERNEQAVLDEGWRKRWIDEDEYIVLSKKLGGHYNINYIDTYEHKAIEDFFLRFYLKDLLKPHKHIVTSAFKKEFDSVGGFRHQSSYQVNSRTRDFHDNLLNSKYNKNSHKGVIGLYNQMAKELKQLTLEL